MGTLKDRKKKAKKVAAEVATVTATPSSIGDALKTICQVGDGKVEAKARAGIGQVGYHILFPGAEAKNGDSIWRDGFLYEV